MFKSEKFKTLKYLLLCIAVLLLIFVLVSANILIKPVTMPEAEGTTTPPQISETVTQTSDLIDAIDSEPDPSPLVRVAFIPDPEDLQAIPNLSTIKLDQGYLAAEFSDDGLKVSWPIVAGADYYLLCVLDGENIVMQKDILWAEITQWELPDFKGASIFLLCYKDMGEDSAADDKLVGSYIDYIAPQATTGVTQGTSNQTTETAASKNKYYIIVDKADHAFSVFTYDNSGEYTIKVATFPCALGKSSRSTPTGEFKISNKGPWKTWPSGRVSPYYTRYTSGLYFHGPMYGSKRWNTLIASSYKEIGTNASSGCVRTTTAGAYFVYAYCPAGTIVDIVKSSDLVLWPGLIPIDPDYTKWDPTDPNKPSAPEALPTEMVTASPAGTASASPTETDATLSESSGN